MIPLGKHTEVSETSPPRDIFSFTSHLEWNIWRKILPGKLLHGNYYTEIDRGKLLRKLPRVDSGKLLEKIVRGKLIEENYT